MMSAPFGAAFARPEERDLSGIDLSGFGPFVEGQVQQGIQGLGTQADGMEDQSMGMMREAGAMQPPTHPGYGMDRNKALIAMGITLGLQMIDPKRQAGQQFANAFGQSHKEKIEHEFATKAQKLDHQRQQKMLEANLMERQAERARQRQRDAQQQMMGGQRLAEDRRQFGIVQETERYKADKTFERGMGVAELNNATKIKVAEVNGYMRGMSSKQKADFINANGGDPAVAEAFRQLTPKEQMEIARAGLSGAQAGLAREKTITERTLRPDRQKELQAKTRVLNTVAGVNKQQALNIAAATDMMGPEFALKAAIGEATIAKLKADTARIPDEQARKWFEANTDRLKADQDAALTGVQAYDDTIKSLSEQAVDIQKQLTDLTIKDEDDSEQALELKDMLLRIAAAKRAAETRRKVLAQDILTIKKKVGGGVTPGKVYKTKGGGSFSYTPK